MTSDEAFQKGLEIIARVLVASPKARRAVKLTPGENADYLLEDMVTNQPMRLVNVIGYNWELSRTDVVFGWADKIDKLSEMARRKGNIPASLICYWDDEHWGVVEVPGQFEIEWAKRPHKQTGRPIYVIPLKDFSILMKYAGKSNEKVTVAH